MSRHRRGRFIAIEGADGVGTTTQARALVARLRRVGAAHRTAEPSRGPIGKLARKLLRGPPGSDALYEQLALLFAADRLDHVAREIEPRLAVGTHVVTDRYLLSSLVYQGLHAPLAWIESLNAHAPAPDVTVVLTVPLKEAQRRLVARGSNPEIFDAASTQKRVHRAYGRLAKAQGALIVDGRGENDLVTDRIVEALRAADVWPGGRA